MYAAMSLNDVTTNLLFFLFGDKFVVPWKLHRRKGGVHFTGRAQNTDRCAVHAFASSLLSHWVIQHDFLVSG